MKVLNTNINNKIQENTYIALGSFDGLHLGHLKLINKTIHLAKENNSKSAIFTFSNHPLSVINSEMTPKLILSNKSKELLLKELNLDFLIFQNFDEKFMRISPYDFIYFLINNFNVKGIVVGFNYRFGYKNQGDISLLKRACDLENIDLHIVESVKDNNEIISSTKIRSLLANGNIRKANRFLNRPYKLTGQVIHGKEIGRKINFPTINLKCDSKFIVPKSGVYLTIVEHNLDTYKGITNIGYNPTVENKRLNIETHIINFNKMIYGEEVTISFIERIRDEQKFSSLEELSEQLKKDKDFAVAKNFENI